MNLTEKIPKRLRHAWLRELRRPSARRARFDRPWHSYYHGVNCLGTRYGSRLKPRENDAPMKHVARFVLHLTCVHMQADETHADLDVRSWLVPHSPAAVGAICFGGDGRASEQEAL